MENHKEEAFQKRSKIKVRQQLQLIENRLQSKLSQKLENKRSLDYSNMKMNKNQKKLKKIIYNSKKKNIEN